MRFGGWYENSESAISNEYTRNNNDHWDYYLCLILKWGYYSIVHLAIDSYFISNDENQHAKTVGAIFFTCRDTRFIKKYVPRLGYV